MERRIERFTGFATKERDRITIILRFSKRKFTILHDSLSKGIRYEFDTREFFPPCSIQRRNDVHCLYPFRSRIGEERRKTRSGRKRRWEANRRGAANRLCACTTRASDICVAYKHRDAANARSRTHARTRLPSCASSLFHGRRGCRTQSRRRRRRRRKLSVEVIGWVYTGRCWILFAEDSDKRPSTSFPLATSASCDSTDTARDITLSNDTFSPLPTSSFSFSPRLRSPPPLRSKAS